MSYTYPVQINLSTTTILDIMKIHPATCNFLCINVSSAVRYFLSVNPEVQFISDDAMRRFLSQHHVEMDYDPEIGPWDHVRLSEGLPVVGHVQEWDFAQELFSKLDTIFEVDPLDGAVNACTSIPSRYGIRGEFKPKNSNISKSFSLYSKELRLWILELLLDAGHHEFSFSGQFSKPE